MKFSIQPQRNSLKRLPKPLLQRVKKLSLKKFQSSRARRHTMFVSVLIRISHRAKNFTANIQRL